MSAITTVIEKFRKTYPDCSSSDAESILADVLKEIYDRLPARNTTLDITLTAGTQEYDFNASVTRTQSVWYKLTSDSSTWSRLSATNVDKLNLDRPLWRAETTNGTPSEYYLDFAPSSDTAKPVIGFLPRPDTTTANGYPKVTCFVTQYADLTSAETLPSHFPSDRVVIYGMCRDFAIRRNKDKDIMKWDKLFEQELVKTENHMRNNYENEDPVEIRGPVFSLTKRV